MPLADRLEELLPAALLGGDEAEFGYSLETIQLRSGHTLEVAPEGVTAIVGGNNVGKSTVLREVMNLVSEGPWTPRQPLLILEGIGATKAGQPKDAVAWLSEHAQLDGPPTHNVVTFRGPLGAGNGLDVGSQVGPWSLSHEASAGMMAGFVAHYADASNRVGMVGAVEMRERSTDPPQHPLHVLEDNHELMERLSDVCMEVFGKGLFLDLLGRQRSLRVGEVSVPAPPVDRVTEEYREAVQALPLLAVQGDGMRSLLGLLIPVLTAAYRLVVIDEPEAFLHPPQARALGVQLGRLASEKHIQVLLATHDAALLSGLLESGAPVSVARLARAGDRTTVSQLRPEDLQELWTDPVLRYTRALEGLFHGLVVLAEGDVDCALLAAGLDCGSRPAIADLPASDVLFLPTGGKAGMAKVAAVLRSVSVRVVVAPDLDILQNEAELRALVEALGGDWASGIDNAWRRATSALRAPKEQVKVQQVLDGLYRALSPHASEAYTDALKEAVRAQIRVGDSPWESVKQHGMSAFKGEAYTALVQLLEMLAAVNIVPVRAGVLERLAPSVAVRKGPRWLRAALEQNEQCSGPVQEHLDRILAAGTHTVS